APGYALPFAHLDRLHDAGHVRGHVELGGLHVRVLGADEAPAHQVGDGTADEHHEHAAEHQRPAQHEYSAPAVRRRELGVRLLAPFGGMYGRRTGWRIAATMLEACLRP